MYQLLLGTILFVTSLFNVPSVQKDEEINGKWKIVPEKSSFDFQIPVLFVFPVSGTFSGVKGTIDISKDLYTIKVDLTIDPATIDTGNDTRDKHLRSEDFFDVEKYPSISFSASTISNEASENQYSVTGDLTIKDVTREIVVPITLEGINAEGQIVFKGSKNINRREYHIDYSGRGVKDVAEVDFTIVGERTD